MKKLTLILTSAVLLQVLILTFSGCEKSEPQIESIVPNIGQAPVAGVRVNSEYNWVFSARYVSNYTGKLPSLQVRPSYDYNPAEPAWLISKGWGLPAIQIKAVSLPSWLKMESKYDTYTLKGIPSAVGEYPVVLEASNGYKSSTISFVIKVEDNADFSGKFVNVPAGTFSYGTRSGNETHSIPYNYQIMKYEVTNSEYAAYLNEAYKWNKISVDDIEQNNSYKIKVVSGYLSHLENSGHNSHPVFLYLETRNHVKFDGQKFYAESGFEYFPVTGITYYGALAFSLHYGFNLPTRDEWQKAARGSNAADFAFGVNYGADITKRANYKNSSDPFDNGPSPVGYFNGQNGTIDSPGPFGTYDMTGNVSEYVLGEYWESWICCVMGGDWNSVLDNIKPGPNTTIPHPEIYTWNVATENINNLEHVSDSYYTRGFRCIKK